MNNVKVVALMTYNSYFQRQWSIKHCRPFSRPLLQGLDCHKREKQQPIREDTAVTPRANKSIMSAIKQRKWREKV